MDPGWRDRVRRSATAAEQEVDRERRYDNLRRENHALQDLVDRLEAHIVRLRNQMDAQREAYARQLEMARQVYSHRSIVEPQIPLIGAIAPGEVVSVSPDVFWQPQHEYQPHDLLAAYEACGGGPAADNPDDIFHVAAEPIRQIDAEAQGRARQLLMTHLDHKQREEFNCRKEFFVQSSAGNMWTVGLTGTIRRSDGHRFCIEIQEPGTPLEDQMLMRKLLLETNEAEFLRIANDLTDTAGLFQRWWRERLFPSMTRMGANW